MKEGERGTIGDHEDLAVEKERRGVQKNMRTDIKSY